MYLFEILQIPTVDQSVHGIPGINKVNFLRGQGMQHRPRLKLYAFDGTQITIQFKLLPDGTLTHKQLGEFPNSNSKRFAYNFLNDNQDIFLAVARGEMDEHTAERKLRPARKR